jgi:broad specificity phosphatase PhoE
VQAGASFDRSVWAVLQCFLCNLFSITVHIYAAIISAAFAFVSAFCLKAWLGRLCGLIANGVKIDWRSLGFDLVLELARCRTMNGLYHLRSRLVSEQEKHEQEKNAEVEKFYFVRHGQTHANLSNLAAGAGWDVELNETGIAQARHLAESEALQACIGVKTICVSPMLRARQTAESLNHVLKAETVTVDDLREWHLGEWEKRAWSELPDLFLPGSNPPGGEAQMEFGMRVNQGLQKALSNPGPVLIVAHGGVWYAISKILQLDHGHIANCQLKEVRRAHKNAAWAVV